MKSSVLSIKKISIFSILLDIFSLTCGVIIICATFGEVLFGMFSNLLNTEISTINRVGIAGVALLSILPMYFAHNYLRGKSIGYRDLESEAWKNLISIIQAFILFVPIIIAILNIFYHVRLKELSALMSITYMISAVYNMTGIVYLVHIKKNPKT